MQYNVQILVMKMNIRPYYQLLIAVLILSNTCVIQAQNSKWQNCLSNKYVKDIASEDNNIWVATTGGLILLNDQLEEIERYTSLNSELLCNDIHKVIVDGQGLVWINHCYGLSSFDGDTFMDYDIDFHRMVLDHNQNVFLMDAEGYHTWDGSTFQFITLESPTQYLSTGDVYVESDETIWVVKLTFGVFQIQRFENGQLTVFDQSNSDLHFEYSSDGIFFKGLDDKLSIILGNSVFSFTDNSWTITATNDFRIVDLEKTIENSNIHVLSTSYIDGSVRSYLGQLSEDNKIITETLLELEGISPHVLSISGANALVGFRERGLHKIQEGEVTKINLTKTDLVSNDIQSMEIVDQKIWIHAGRSEYDRVGSILTFEDFVWEEQKGTSPFLAPENISFIFDDGIGDTTYMNYNRKSYYQANSTGWTLAQNPDLVEDVDENNVSVFIDKYGDKWLLERYTSDIYYQSPSGWKVIPHEIHGARSGHYFSKFNHPETGDLWLSSYNGLSIYNYESDSWTLLEDSDMNIVNDPMTFVTLSTGEIYGIARREFFRLEGNQAEILITSDSLELDNNFRFWTIMVDNTDRIWLGLNGSVAIYDHGEWSYLTRENSGMINGIITSITQDESGNFWFGSATGGIAIYNEEGLDDHFFTKIQSDVNEINNQDNVRIYPIPTDGLVNFENISQDINSEVTQIKVFTISGNLVMNIDSIQQNSLDLSGLSAGMYIIQFGLVDEIFNVRVIKN